MHWIREQKPSGGLNLLELLLLLEGLRLISLEEVLFVTIILAFAGRFDEGI